MTKKEFLASILKIQAYTKLLSAAETMNNITDACFYMKKLELEVKYLSDHKSNSDGTRYFISEQ